MYTLEIEDFVRFRIFIKLRKMEAELYFSDETNHLANKDLYEKKLGNYLHKRGLTQKYDECRIEALKNMLNKLNMNKRDDIHQLAYVMWNKSLYEYLLVLLDNGELLKIIDLDKFAEVMIKNPPFVELRGRMQCIIGDTCAHYSCIKFIGQFTKSQEVYNKCVSIVKSLPKELNGPIIKPFDVLYLMSFNKWVKVETLTDEILKNKDKMIDVIGIKEFFFYSIYCPNPSQEEYYYRYLEDIEASHIELYNLRNACSVLIAEKTQDLISTICLADIIIHSHYSTIQNTKNLAFYCQSIMKSNCILEISQILVDINREEIVPNITQPSDFNRSKKFKDTYKF